jgi:beta-lactamase class A
MKKTPSGQKNFLKLSIIGGTVGLVVFGLALSPILLGLKSFSSEKAQADKQTQKIHDDLYDRLMQIIQARAQEFPGEVGIYIKNLRTGDAVGLNDDRLFPSASLVKLPIMAAVYMADEEKKLSLNDTIKLKRGFKVRDCSRLYLRETAGDIRLKSLLSA